MPFSELAAHRAIAEALRRNAQWAAAAGEYEIVLCIERSDAEAWAELASTYVHVGRYKDAICGYESCLKHAPGHIGCQHGLARARNYEEAQSSEKLFKLLPFDATGAE